MRVDPELREEWINDLNAPVPGTEKAQPNETQIEQEGADFMATMIQHQQLTTGG